MVFQHFMLADNLTVLENVVLGAEKLHGIGDDGPRRGPARSPTSYGFGLDPDELVETLGVGERQRVEILKVLYRGAKIIILDEPTAVLVPQEVDALFDNLRELKAEGHTLIFISHKLDEVLEVADDITVIRRGTTVATVKPAGGHRPPARRADGRQRAARRRAPRSPRSPTVRSASSDLDVVDSSGRPVLNDINFDHPRAARCSASPASRATARPSWSRPSSACAAATRRGQARRPGHQRTGRRAAPRGRHRLHPRGPAPPRAAARRAALGEPHPRPPDPAAERSGRLDRRAGARDDTARIIERVRRPHARRSTPPPGALSGGNQQKFIVGREMSGDPRC